MNRGPLSGKSLLHGDLMMAPVRPPRRNPHSVLGPVSGLCEAPKGDGEGLPASHDAVTLGFASPRLPLRGQCRT
jgi:hypothetical protein